MTLLARLNKRGASLAFVTLTVFASSALRPSPAWAQSAQAVPELEAATSSRPAAPVATEIREPAAPQSTTPGEETILADPIRSSTGEEKPGEVTSSPPVAPEATPSPASKAAAAASVAVPRALPTGDKSGVTNKTISVPKGSGTIEGMGESFSAQLSTGIATFSVPFALPAARGGVQPSLGLSYSSSGGLGVAGLGWEVGVPFIARQTDRGPPKYLDQASWHPEQDRFVFNGGQELVPICVVGSALECAGALKNVATPSGPVNEEMPVWSAGWQYFRPRVEGSFLRFFWSPDHRTWRVQDKSGVSMELGVPLNDATYTNALESNPDKPNEIFRWHLVRQYDAHGDVNLSNVPPQPKNVVVYRYLSPAENEGMAYLSDIFDTTPAATPTTTNTALYAHHTRLVYEKRSDPTRSYRSGWPIEQRLRLKRVDVTSKRFAASTASARRLVRRYHLDYEPSRHVSLLASVQMEGRGGSSENTPASEDANQQLPEETGNARLPAMKLGYSHVTPFTTSGGAGVADLTGYEGFDERVQTLANSPEHSLDEQLTELFDINSDALPDVVVTATGLYGPGHGVFFNGSAGAMGFGRAQPLSVAGVLGATSGTITLRNLNVAPLDLDGDATIDLLHMPKVKTYSVYTPRNAGSGWVWEGRAIDAADQQSPKIDFGQDAGPDTRVLDVNYDGLVDVVVSTGTEFQTFLSLGRYPGGDGQFGHARWTSASTAQLFNDPIRTCVPFSGTPVRFSDSEVKLGDMNGDGITDIVRVSFGNVIYWPGRGNGFWGTGRRDDCPAGKFADGRHIVMSNSPQLPAVEGESFRLDDVNGDGLSDLVRVRYTDVDVWLNVDGVGWTGRHVIAGTPASPAFANRVRLTDVNGSGTPDLLWGDSGRYRYIDLAGGTQPGLLTRIENGLGKTTEIEYSTSVAEMLAAEVEPVTDDDRGPWSKRMPISVRIVKRVTERDNLELVGRPAGKYVTEYAYRDPVYEGRQREFRGFSRTRVTRLGDANSPTDITKTRFLLGECVDTDASAQVDTCDLDNTRDALKGLPVVTEKRNEAGVYLVTEVTPYMLRHLYTGLDGRAVRHAFNHFGTRYPYDTTGFSSLPDPLPMTFVTIEGSNEPGEVETVIRRGMGRSRMRYDHRVDSFGNKTRTIDIGCEGACETGPGGDEIIDTYTDPALVPNDGSRWMWRTVRSYVTGSAHAGIRNDQRTTYNSAGDPVDSFAALSGSLPLDRTNAAGVPGASTPADASVDGEIQTSHREYDTLGLGTLVREVGPNGRCSEIGYDDQYEQLPTSETIYVGGASPFGFGQCGPEQLVTGASYDRALGKPTVVVDANLQSTLIAWDAFGRLALIARTPPDGSLPAFVNSSVRISYMLADKNGKPFSAIRTRVQDAPGNTGYIETWNFVDGLGRNLMTLKESEVQNRWIVSDFVGFDAKGAVARKHFEYYWVGSLTENINTGSFNGNPPIASASTVFARQEYDAFGREVRRTNYCGIVELETRYKRQSRNLYDALDLTNNTYATELTDGHGRVAITVERIRVNNVMEQRRVVTQYLPTGEPEVITRERGTDQVVRWMRYDSLGRMVFNVEPNTSANFNASPSTPAPPVAGYSSTALKAWRYAYNNAGDLVGTSDARGCGVNFFYEAGGRLLGEDYSPCTPEHAPYTAPDPAAGTGLEVYYQYDDANLPPAAGLSPPPATGTNGDPNYSPGFAKGRLVSVHDRGSSRWSTYDVRGRVTLSAVRVARPDAPPNGFTDRYAPRWYYQSTAYDLVDREIHATTGAKVADLLGSAVTAVGTDPYQKSVVSTTYTTRGTVQSVGGSYGTLVNSVSREVDGLVSEIVYGDAASTTTDFDIDLCRRVTGITTSRATPSLWSSPPANYLPAPDLSPSNPTTFQMLLQDDEIEYDVVNNPIRITDWRTPEPWPAGAKPVDREFSYDDLYRVAAVDYTYDAADDVWTSPFDAENDGLNDPRRADPTPHIAFTHRTHQQTFQYDWLGNTSNTGDDAGGFYDRSLGTITNGTASAQPYQLKSATNQSVVGATSTGQLSTVYDAAGNLTRLNVQRNGTCLPENADCSQRFAYDWDEVGRLVRARRWDFTGVLPPADGSLPPETDSPEADLRHVYDANDMRVAKIAKDSAGIESTTVYIFDSLELRRAAFTSGDYERSHWTEVPYLFANGVRLARLVYEEPDPEDVPSIGGARLHVLFELGDHLGSTSVVLDKATGELVERSTFYAYGGTESDYRPDRWQGFREDYRFTGKEEDVEVGLQYFGKRFLNPLLGRWMSPDPLTVHTYGGDLNAYAYVSGAALRATDPMGLDVTDFVYGIIDKAAVAADRKIEAAKAAVVQSMHTMKQDAQRTAAALQRKDYKQAATDIATLAYNAGPGKPIEQVKALMKVPEAFERRTVEAGGSIVRATRAGNDREAGREAAGAVGAAMEFAGTVLSPFGLVRGKLKVGCFVAGTPVWTIEGLKPIELVEVGDWVLSASEVGDSSPTWRRVSRTFPKPASQVIELTLQAYGSGMETIGVTRNHPLWAEHRGWIQAGSLVSRDRVWSISRGWLTVTSVRAHPNAQPVFNFEVETDHTYAVGELGLWAHNQDCSGRGKTLAAPRAGKDFTDKGKGQVRQDNPTPGQCQDCGNPVQPATKHRKGVRPPDNESHVDHRLPKDEGGLGEPHNGQELCRACNLGKSNSATMHPTTDPQAGNNTAGR